jgi:hypothetical protein
MIMSGDDERRLWETNRSRKLRPRSRRGYWCRGCDACLVRESQKCPVCGRRHDKRRLKKETDS